MLKLCLTDKLVIFPITSPVNWKYRISYISTTPVVITSATGIVATYAEVTLTSAIFSSYVGKELLVEVLNNYDVVLERGFFLISGIYNKITSIERLTQLLGENIKKLAENTSDWQDGHLRSQEIKTYTDNTLVTEVDEYAWAQTFDADYIPDARYQTYRVSSKEAT